MEVTILHSRSSGSYSGVVRGILKNAARVVDFSKKTSVSVVFVGDQKMRELNRKYRGKDKTTNVLAFASNANRVTQNAGNATRYTLHATDQLDLGDIFISIPEAKREAKKYGWTIRYTVAHLTLHGFLHLLGYGHIKNKDAREMEELEQRILKDYVKH